LDWRNSNGLSRTTYLDDDIDAGRSVSLHFDDIYSRPPETPPAFRDPPTF
jgi:autophagy-related protein 9